MKTLFLLLSVILSAPAYADWVYVCDSVSGECKMVYVDRAPQ